MEYPLVTEYILNYLYDDGISEWQYDELLKEIGYDDSQIDKMEDEEKESAIEKFMDYYIYIDDQLQWYDLEEGYACRIMYFKYKNNIFGVQYCETYDIHFDEISEPFQVIPNGEIKETIFKRIDK